jgi:hypothetical protein
MILMYFRRHVFAVVLMLLPLMGQAAPSNMLIYIHPNEYKHPLKLWQFYSDYWFEQGPVIEPLAQVMLAEAFGEIGMCGADNEARSLVWIQPRIYYNPHMTVFYGEIRASVYTSHGEPVATYLGEASKQGFLDVVPKAQIETVYRAAMQDLIADMQKDPGLAVLVADGKINHEPGGACALIPNLPPPKLFDLDYLIKGVN